MIPVISYTNLKGRESPGGIRDLRHETKLHTDQVFLDRIIKGPSPANLNDRIKVPPVTLVSPVICGTLVRYIFGP